MGKPLPTTANPATATPPSGDQATVVITGQITALGPTLPFVLFGSFNIALWASVTTTLTTTAASATGALASGTGVAVGQAINSSLVPPGATVTAVSGTSISMGGLTATQIAAIAAGADAAAIFEPAVPTATVRIERSFDGGSTWITAGIGGLPAVFDLNALGGAASVVVTEPEKGVAYRLNCTSYAAGTINYRISSSGHGALTANVP